MPPAVRAGIEEVVFSADVMSVLVRADLNGDGQDEIVFAQQDGNYVLSYWFRLDHGRWLREEMRATSPDASTDLKSGAIEVRDSEFRDLSIGGVLLQPVQPD